MTDDVKKEILSGLVNWFDANLWLLEPGTNPAMDWPTFNELSVLVTKAERALGVAP